MLAGACFLEELFPGLSSKSYHLPCEGTFALAVFDFCGLHSWVNGLR